MIDREYLHVGRSPSPISSAKRHEARISPDPSFHELWSYADFGVLIRTDPFSDGDYASKWMLLAAFHLAAVTRSSFTQPDLGAAQAKPDLRKRVLKQVDTV